MVTVFSKVSNGFDLNSLLRIPHLNVWPIIKNENKISITFRFGPSTCTENRPLLLN